MEKENLKLTNTISSLITDDLKKNTKHESLEHDLVEKIKLPESAYL
jgi:hypothetical protein